MWTFIPVILILCTNAESRPEPMNYAGYNRQNEMLFPVESMSQPEELNNFNDLSSRLKQITMDDSTNLQNWNKHYQFDSNAQMDSVMNDDDDVVNNFENTQTKEIDEEELKQLTGFLAALLRQPVWGEPIMVVEDISNDYNQLNEDVSDAALRSVTKRQYSSRWKYPYKRQHENRAFDYESLYLCKPSRDDIIHLLRALHDVRNGNKSRTVNYCKRRRPVSTIFTNIRFLGRRK